MIFNNWKTFVSLSIAAIISTASANVEFKMEKLNANHNHYQVVSGDTYEERAANIMKVMSEMEIPSSSIDFKYIGPYVSAKLCMGKDIEIANKSWGLLAQDVFDNVAKIDKGSAKHFYLHAAMNGYFVGQKNLSEENKAKTKKVLESFDLCDLRGTINMKTMLATAVFLASEEWSDLKDVKGNDAKKINANAKKYLLEIFDTFFYNNNFEMDAFTYFPTNVMYIRSLMEFAKDKEISQKAEIILTKMIAATLPSWNKGMYVASPFRSKGYENLYTNQHSLQGISVVTWVWLGNPINESYHFRKIGKARASLSILPYYVSYPGKFKMPEIFGKIASAKVYPYTHKAFATDSVAKYYKTTYHSDNYSLASLFVEHNDRNNVFKRYGYKEIKRNLLAWTSNGITNVFTVCQDNPQRPFDLVNQNPIGYGENPYHRVLQFEGTVIGAFNIPKDYIEGKRYAIYVPFTQKGIATRIERDNYILCHTNSMMFAFSLVDPTIWNKAIFTFKDYDILSYKDAEQRSGVWVLEATEITDDLKGANNKEELEKFYEKIKSNSKLNVTKDSENNPTINYTDSNNNNLILTYFSPAKVYKDEYKINGKTINPKDNKLVLDSPVLQQKRGSNIVEVITPEERMKITYPKN